MQVSVLLNEGIQVRKKMIGQGKSVVAPWRSSVVLQEEKQPFGWVEWN